MWILAWRSTAGRRHGLRIHVLAVRVAAVADLGPLPPWTAGGIPDLCTVRRAAMAERYLGATNGGDIRQTSGGFSRPLSRVYPQLGGSML